MALKNVFRRTYSLPKATIIWFEMNIPKNKRSKHIAQLIEKDKKDKQSKNKVTLEDITEYWKNAAKYYHPKVKKSAVEMQRVDRLSH